MDNFKKFTSPLLIKIMLGKRFSIGTNYSISCSYLLGLGFKTAYLKINLSISTDIPRAGANVAVVQCIEDKVSDRLSHILCYVLNTYTSQMKCLIQVLRNEEE